MKRSSISKFIAIAAILGTTSAVMQAVPTDQAATDFTCVVLEFEENGCTADDYDLIGDMMAKLFYTELDLTQVVLVDTVASTEEVFTMSTTATSYDLGTRKLQTNPCKTPGYCASNPNVCRIYGCPGYRRRNLRALQTNSSTYDMGDLSFKGSMMLDALETTNADCNFKELGFQCDLV